LEDVSDFPRLEILQVNGTKVTGDIREIGRDDFKSLEELDLGEGVYGGGCLMAIQDAPSIMFARYQLLKRMPGLFTKKRWSLTRDSTDRTLRDSWASLPGAAFFC
jgi:hypothetical protein